MANFATLSQVKTFLGITSSAEDALITTMLDRTTKLIQNYVGRDLVQTTYTDVKYDGDGCKDLLLINYPIITLTSVYDDYDRIFGADSLLVEDDGTNDGDYIIIKKGEVDNPGIIRRIDGACWIEGDQNIKISYVGGYATIPTDLVQAQIDWLSFIYRNKDMRLGIASYRLGDFSVNFKDSTSKDQMGNSLGPALPPDDVRMILDCYKDPRMESTAYS